MNPAILASIAYGLLSIVGGIVGYTKAKSKPSLISGTISGILLIVSAYLQLQTLGIGLILAQIITLLLVVVFGIRLSKTRKFMPAGLMLLFGVVTLACLLA